jgi:integrase
MAALNWYAPRKCWRIEYTLYLRQRKVRRARYSKDRAVAGLLLSQAQRVEEATHTGLSTQKEIEEWVERGWLSPEQANLAFSGFAEATDRKRLLNPEATDYERILAAYEQYVASVSQREGGRKNRVDQVNVARRVMRWLEADFPSLSDLTVDDVAKYRVSLQGQGYAPWTVFHRLTALRLLVDQAIAMGMVRENPARQVSLYQPKKTSERRILSEEEARQLLTLSLNHRELISGSLPTVVRLGLYAGLRNQEMCWLKWDSIDWNRRIITIKEVECEATGEKWVPKDHELRRLDVKEACTDYLEEERKRQTKEGLLGPFVMPGGGPAHPGFRGKPLSQDGPQRAFARMLEAEGLDLTITVYSLRHTYATMALRSAIDIRTLQKRMGHSDIKTTMEYLHFIEPEEHPMDKLPY